MTDGTGSAGGGGGRSQWDSREVTQACVGLVEMWAAPAEAWPGYYCTASRDDVDLQGFGHKGLVGVWPCFMGVDMAHLGHRGWGGE